MQIADTQSSFQAGLVALQARDWRGAREHFEALTQSGGANAEAWTMLAVACERLGDVEAAHGATAQALRLEPRHLRANMVKADLFYAQGKLREANVYYRALLNLGADARQLPRDLAAGMARARALQERLKTAMVDELVAALERAGYSRASSSARFTHAVDLLTGKRQVYAQQPLAFLFPELPTIQFYDRGAFPWLEAIEAETAAITQELMALRSDAEAFEPHYKSDPRMPLYQKLADSMDWSISALWKNGAPTPSAARCPRTMAALAQAPLCRTKGRSPMILFSQLKPGAHIEPHTGYVNTRLICHLPLIAPPECRFRVGNEVRPWRRGESLVFDDTIEHEGWNSSDQNRAVLIYDIWRPELNQEERTLVTTLLETLDGYSGAEVREHERSA